MYYTLPNAQELPDASALTSERARRLAAAAERHGDVTLIQVLTQSFEGGRIAETLVIDITCDGVPSKNSAGIRYRERLGLRIWPDPKMLVEVLALRQDFPTLIHLNQSDPGQPASLCLYFDPPKVVHRTWTAEGFFRRIQWWLEANARGTLHPADQPLEHLFFDTGLELVLPWNFEAERQDPNKRIVVFQAEPRSTPGLTCRLRILPKDETVTLKTLNLIELELPPVVHGQVERDPATLGQLHDRMVVRGADLFSLLKRALDGRVGTSGASVDSDDPATILLLRIPLRRSTEDMLTHTIQRAFFLKQGGLALGEATGILMRHEGRYFSAAGLIDPAPPTAWQDEPLFGMSVLHQNDAARARAQSGIADEGPDGVLVGAGSLGSALLNLWGRAGWGQWTVIDKDHVKPHNLSRHTARADDVGRTKAHAVAHLHAEVTDGASVVRPIVADVVEDMGDELLATFSETQVVVDVSTTLEFPRAMSGVDGVARHVSVFVTPAGNAAVLLAEDVRRRVRLRSLEAQYYRAIIEHPWGADHLTDAAGAFWSGASCRDLSVVLPYSRILAHASTLAEQIPSALAVDEATIAIWHRNADTGAVDYHRIDAAISERAIPLGSLTLFIDANAEAQLRALREGAFPNETGGALLGYYDFNIQAVVVVAGLPAPPDSKGTPSSFERGTDGLRQVVSEAARRTAGIVGYIGEWHSHPPGHNARASIDDLTQLAHLAVGMAADGLPAIQLIVGEHDVRALQGRML